MGRADGQGFSLRENVGHHVQDQKLLNLGSGAVVFLRMQSCRAPGTGTSARKWKVPGGGLAAAVVSLATPLSTHGLAVLGSL